MKERLVTLETKILAQKIGDVHWARWWMESFAGTRGKDDDRKEKRRHHNDKGHVVFSVNRTCMLYRYWCRLGGCHWKREFAGNFHRLHHEHVGAG